MTAILYARRNSGASLFHENDEQIGLFIWSTRDGVVASYFS
jgi:hypothetical protein